MVWKSWGGVVFAVAAAAAALLCSSDAADDVVSVSFSKTPPSVSRSASAVFTFQVLHTNGSGPCQDCLITCKVTPHFPPACFHSMLF